MAINLSSFHVRQLNDYVEDLNLDSAKDLSKSQIHKFATKNRLDHVYNGSYYFYGKGNAGGSVNIKTYADGINNLVKESKVPQNDNDGIGLFNAAMKEVYRTSLVGPFQQRGPGYQTAGLDYDLQKRVTKRLKDHFFNNKQYDFFKGTTTDGFRLTEDMTLTTGGQVDWFTGQLIGEEEKTLTKEFGSVPQQYTFADFDAKGFYDEYPDGVRQFMDNGNYITKEFFNNWYTNLAEEKEQEAKDVVVGGFEDYANKDGGDIDLSNIGDEDDTGNLLQGYGSDGSSGSKSQYSGKSPIDPNSQLYTYGKEAHGKYRETEYVKGRIPKTTGMRAVLGEEIFNLGLEDENGNMLTPESLSQFATYTSEDGVEKPLIEYENALVDKMQKGDKDPGVDARSLLATRAKQGVIGAASAAGKSLQQNIQDVTMGKMAGRQAASSAMGARVSAIEDKLNARQSLSKLKTELLAHNLKREQNLYKLKSKTAVGLAGLEETAASYAKELLEIKKK